MIPPLRFPGSAGMAHAAPAQRVGKQHPGNAGRVTPGRLSDYCHDSPYGRCDDRRTRFVVWADGFLFGTELTGLSDTVIAQADEFVKVPMYGFTESLNISVCAALVMYSVTRRLRESTLDWHLPEEQRDEVLFRWYRNAIKASDEILERFNR